MLAPTLGAVNPTGGERHFPLDVDRRYRILLAPFRLGPDDGVRLTEDDRFVAMFGRLKLETPLDNVTGAHVTTGYRWWKAIGARLSFADDGLTFGSNTAAGVCVHFAERVPKVVGFRDHSALTVTVAEPDALVEALGEEAPR